MIAFDDPEPQLSYSPCTLLPICLTCTSSKEKNPSTNTNKNIEPTTNSDQEMADIGEMVQSDARRKTQAPPGLFKKHANLPQEIKSSQEKKPQTHRQKALYNYTHRYSYRTVTHAHKQEKGGFSHCDIMTVFALSFTCSQKHTIGGGRKSTCLTLVAWRVGSSQQRVLTLRTPGLKHHSTIFYLNNKTKRVLVYDRIGGVAHSRTHQKKEKEKQETPTHLLQEN